MFCKSCGKEIKDDIKFCPACGNAVKKENSDPIDELYDNVNNTIQANKKKAMYVVAAVVVVILIAVLSGDSDVKIVKDGSFYQAQHITVGKAFDKFFKNGKWSSKVSNGVHYVYFNGECEVLNGRNDRVKFNARFTVNPKTKSFVMEHIDVEGVDLTFLQDEFVREICSGQNGLTY